MKSLILLLLIFLAACAVPEVIEEEQEIEEEIIKEVVEEVKEEIEEEVDMLDEVEIVEAEVDGKDVQIEILGVSKDNSGCLIKVGNETGFILDGESGTIGGITIHVSEVVSFHSEPPTASCKLIL